MCFWVMPTVWALWRSCKLGPTYLLSVFQNKHSSQNNDVWGKMTCEAVSIFTALFFCPSYPTLSCLTQHTHKHTHTLFLFIALSFTQILIRIQMTLLNDMKVKCCQVIVIQRGSAWQNKYRV